MSQTILIEPSKKLSQIFKINLSTYTGTDVIERASSAEAIELLRILPEIDLIVCRNEVGNEKTAQDIYQFLVDSQIETPMIILGESLKISDKILCLADPFSWEDLVSNARNLLGITGTKAKIDLQPDYSPIGIQYFFDIDHTPCDVYIRLKKTNSEFKFVKRLHEQDSFTPEDINKYKDQGLKNFYIPRDYQQYFVTFVTNSMIKKLEQAELPLIERLSVNSNAYNIIKEHIQKIGFTQEINELTEANISSMISSIQQAPQLAVMLKLILTSKVSYAYQKAHIICVIGNFILSKQSWFEKRHLQMFTQLAFFADITLKSNKQMKINTKEELDASDLSTKEKLEVLNHPLNASKIVKGFSQTSDYLELILKQHHGNMDGLGFNNDPDDDIHPLARVFIISDAFVKLMLDPGSPSNKKDILTILYMQFSKNSFQKVIKVLEQKIE